MCSIHSLRILVPFSTFLAAGVTVEQDGKNTPFVSGAMLTFVYRNTFIAESSLPSLPRSRSCPSFDADSVEEPAAVYVAELQQKCQDLRFQVRPQVEEEDETCEVPVQVPRPQVEEEDETCEVPVQVPRPQVEEEDEMCEVPVQVPRPQVEEEDEMCEADLQEVQQPVGDAPSSLGSRGHPLLCRRPCIRFNKGNCDMGNECEYCHFGEHRTFKSLDKRERQKVQEMDAFLGIDKYHFITFPPFLQQSEMEHSCCQCQVRVGVIP